MDKYLEIELERPTSGKGVATDYNDLDNKPQINGVTLEGNKTPQDLKITTSQLENNGDGSSPFATEEYVNIHGGKIDVIELNGEPQEITDKTVNLVVNKSTVGLSNVDNTSDANKPVSTAQQNAIDAVQSNLDEEITRAQGAESTLQQNITKEETRATKAEQALQTAITTETNRADEMEKSIQTKLNAEIADRKSGDSTLTTNLNNEITRATNAENANATNIEAIQKVIPNQASETNQLADKAFVNSSVNAVAATFRGNFATKAALDAWQAANPGVAKKNDYAIVQQDETHSNEQWRYLYQTTWEAQYKVNDAPFTEAQNAAINSGATKAIIDSVANKLNKSDVLNASGSATDKPISQNAATQVAQNVQDNLEAHINDTDNPHSVTKQQVGLGSVDNTSDNDKPISTAQQTALNGKLDKVTTSTTSQQAYVKNADGTQDMVNVDFDETGSSIVKRRNDGTIDCNDGKDNKQAATVGQMNTAIAAAQPYHITLTGYTGTITQEQYNKLKADDRSYIYFTNDQVTVARVLSRDTGLYYNAATGVAQYRLFIRANLSYTMEVFNLELQSNKKTSITGDGNDTDYPTTKAVVDYVADNAGKPYHIDIGTSAVGSITQEQFDKLEADINSYVIRDGLKLSRIGELGNNLIYQVINGLEVRKVIFYQSDLQYSTMLFGLETPGNKTDTLSSSSTTTQYPSAKATYDADQSTLTAAKSYADSILGAEQAWLQKITTGEGV